MPPIPSKHKQIKLNIHKQITQLAEFSANGKPCVLEIYDYQNNSWEQESGIFSILNHVYIYQTDTGEVCVRACARTSKANWT